VANKFILLLPNTVVMQTWVFVYNVRPMFTRNLWR